FNVLGQEVHTPVDAQQPSGRYRVSLDSRDVAGGALASGVYLYRLEAAGPVQTRTMLLVKQAAGARSGGEGSVMARPPPEPYLPASAVCPRRPSCDTASSPSCSSPPRASRRQRPRTPPSCPSRSSLSRRLFPAPPACTRARS